MPTEVQTTFTPGPWDVEPENGVHESGPADWKLRVYARDPGPENDFHIAIVRDADKGTREANARLIAAAPELLEALEEVVAISDRKHNAWDKAHTAIAKARGRQ